jgi:Ni/Fe-hydrogenase subunit HybB-like protein
MAMFGFVYAWYLMVVLLLEIWFDYRHDLIKWSARETGIMRFVHRVMTLGADDVSPRALRFDNAAGRIITIVGIPSAFLLHGYVGFIFGSVKANPWWSSVLIPVVFLFSAIVSGIAAVLLIYVTSGAVRHKPVDEACMGKLASFLFYALTVDFSLEMLDFIHRLYTAEESIKILSALVTSRLFISLVVMQVLLGTLIPLVTLALTSPAFERRAIVKIPAALRRRIFVVAALLVEVGIFSTRWNVVIGGQLFSKSLRGLTVYKLQMYGLEGLWVSVALLLLPLAILLVLIRILPPWTDAATAAYKESQTGAVITPC